MPVLWMSGESLFHPHLYSPLTEVYSVGRTIMQVVLFNRYPMFEMYDMTLEQKLIKVFQSLCRQANILRTMKKTHVSPLLDCHLQCSFFVTQ